jgi:hypothetical protein
MKEVKTAIEVEILESDHLLAGEDLTVVKSKRSRSAEPLQKSYLTFILLPAIFITVTLLGGLRLGAANNAFIFLKPALVCLVFAALTLVLFFRSGMISIEGWIAEDRSLLENAAGVAVLLSLFTATVQLYNSLLPEQGLTFWVVGFCFFWTIWNNLFAEFDAKRLLRSMFALFGLAFVVKYLVLANITAAPTGSWWQRLFENPGKEAFTWLLELPKYSAGTGYIQFFTLALYLIGLFLIPRKSR